MIFVQPVQQLAQHAAPAMAVVARPGRPAADCLVLMAAECRVRQLVVRDSQPHGPALGTEDDGSQHP